MYKRTIRTTVFAVLSVLLLLATCLVLTLSVGAESNLSRLSDGAGLLSTEEADQLEALLDKYSKELKFDIVVVTTNDLQGKSHEAYADDYYDDNGYGQGRDRDGVLFLRYINGTAREAWISSHGEGIDALSDSDIQGILDNMRPYIESDPYRAFEVFAQDVHDEVEDHRAYDVTWIFVGLIIGLATGLIVTGIMRSRLKSVRAQKYAGSYIKDGSMNITVARDIYLYRTISRTAKPKQDSGGGRGGSSTHKSSSGSTHGGGGRSM